MQRLIIDDSPQYNEKKVVVNRLAVHINNLEGALVRSEIPITIRNWRVVPEDMKNKLWESIKVIQIMFICYLVMNWYCSFCIYRTTKCFYSFVICRKLAIKMRV